MKPATSDATRVPHERLEAFIHEAATANGIPDDQATRLAALLIDSDLRGVMSHGSIQIVRYTHEIRSGGINPQPNVAVVHESDNSAIVDGDGGLGYFPALEGTQRVIEKAKAHGMAAMITRNHGHIGAAGHYPRLTLEHDLLTFMTSGVQLHLNPGNLVTAAAGASPMSFSAPTRNEPPFVFDCGVTHDIQGDPPHRDEIARLAPGLVLRAIGFGTVCQTWGGLLTGLPIDHKKADRTYRAANQGAMMYAMRLDLFADPEAFKSEMDEYVRRVRQLQPLENTPGAYLPGSIEAEREQRHRAEGVPLGDRHRAQLEEVADELGIKVPWQ